MILQLLEDKRELYMFCTIFQELIWRVQLNKGVILVLRKLFLWWHHLDKSLWVMVILRRTGLWFFSEPSQSPPVLLRTTITQKRFIYMVSPQKIFLIILPPCKPSSLILSVELLLFLDVEADHWYRDDNDDGTYDEGNQPNVVNWQHNEYINSFEKCPYNNCTGFFYVHHTTQTA